MAFPAHAVMKCTHFYFLDIFYPHSSEHATFALSLVSYFSLTMLRRRGSSGNKCLQHLESAFHFNVESFHWECWRETEYENECVRMCVCWHLCPQKGRRGWGEEGGVCGGQGRLESYSQSALATCLASRSTCRPHWWGGESLGLRPTWWFVSISWPEDGRNIELCCSSGVKVQLEKKRKILPLRSRSINATFNLFIVTQWFYSM